MTMNNVHIKAIDHGASFEICGIHYHKELFSEWGINGMPPGTCFELVSRDGDMITIKRHDGEPIEIRPLPRECRYQNNEQPIDLLPESPIHNWFELSYASFLTLPRLIMQSMPHEWQAAMVKLLEEMDDTYDWRPKGNDCYWVQLRNENGQFTELPESICDSRHGSVEHLRKQKRGTE